MSTSVNPNSNANMSNTSATTADSGVDVINTNHTNSTRHRSSGNGGGGSSWTQIVRGNSPDLITPVPASSSAVVSASSSMSGTVVTGESVSVTVTEASASASVEAEGEKVGGSENGDNAGGKKPAWNKQQAPPVSNGEVEIGPVMGGAVWPALSESAAGRVSGKQQDSSSPRGSFSDGSSLAQGSGSANSSSQRQNSHNANTNSTTNHTLPTRQRSMKRNGGANTSLPSSSNGGASQPPGSQLTQTGEVHLSNPSPRDLPAQRNSQPRNDQQQRNSFRRNGGGPHIRDSSHHHNYGNRRDHDRSNQDWNNHRNISGRDGHMQPQRGGFHRVIRHPTPHNTSPQFVAPAPIRPFGSPMQFPEITTPVSPMFYVPHVDFRGAVSVVAAPIPTLYYSPEAQFHSRILSQIEYYFSNENLIKDTYLRQNMDEQGWVPITLIAGFNRVSALTTNIQIILDSLRSSKILEVQGDKVRKQVDWGKWVMPPSVPFASVSGSSSTGRSSPDMLATHVQGLTMEENVIAPSSGRNQVNVRNETFVGGSSSGELNSLPKVSSFEESGQASVRGVSDLSTSTRSLSK